MFTGGWVKPLQNPVLWKIVPRCIKENVHPTPSSAGPTHNNRDDIQMRYLNRQSLIDRMVPKGAIVLDDQARQLTYAHDGYLITLSIMQVPSSCEDCTTLYCGFVTLRLVVDDILKAGLTRHTLTLHGEVEVSGAGTCAGGDDEKTDAS